MATYRKRGAGWRAEVVKQGVRESATFDTKAQAVAWATQMEADILAGKVKAIADSLTLASVLAKYRDEVCPTKRGGSWETKRINLYLREFDFVGKKIDKVTPEDLKVWRDKRLKVVKTSTVNRDFNLISAIFHHARSEWRYCSSSPVTDVRRPDDPPPRVQRITDKMADLLIEGLGYSRWDVPKLQRHKVALAFLFAIETGMRSGEIMNLTADAVHLEQRFVHIPISKNSDARDVPLSTTAVQILLLLLPSSDEFVFGVSAANRDAIWRKFRDAAGKLHPELASVNFHDTRHEAISRLAKKLDVLDLARMIGHRDLNSLMIYYNEHASEMAKRLG